MIKGLNLFFVFLICQSCSNSDTLDTKNQELITKQIRKTLTDYYRDIKENGLTAEFKYLDKSEDFFWVPPGYKSAITYDSVYNILTHSAPKFKSIDNAFDSLRIIPLSDNIATYTGKIKSVITDTTGKIMSLTLLETGIMIKRGNNWKILSGQTSMINE